MLFPVPSGEVSQWTEPPPAFGGGWTEEFSGKEVSEEKFAGAVKRMREKNTAPGPSGVLGKAWALAFKVLGTRMRHLFNRCLKEGIFSPVWREAELILLRKESKPGYRPICLLDEKAKLLERVIADRLVRHLE